MRALSMIRESLHYRKECFDLGLRSAGFDLVDRLDKPTPDDVLVIWNRYGAFDEEARRFEATGARVVVAENGYLGKHWEGDEWFALALDHHAGAGIWYPLDTQRWDALSVKMEPWRRNGDEVVIIGQRGIGERGIASPVMWAETVRRRLGVGRIRLHPGHRAPAVSLTDDLRKAQAVVTWASSAALRALMLGVPVWYEMDRWIGKTAGRPLSKFGGVPLCNDMSRLNMFRSLIWAQWRLSEIREGTAFEILLHRHRAAA